MHALPHTTLAPERKAPLPQVIRILHTSMRLPVMKTLAIHRPLPVQAVQHPCNEAKTASRFPMDPANGPGGTAPCLDDTSLSTKSDDKESAGPSGSSDGSVSPCLRISCLPSLILLLPFLD